MAGFLIERRTGMAPGEAWERVTDWHRHARHVPLTSVAVEPAGPTQVGTWYTARTGIGPIAADDPMEVVVWEPPESGGPGRCRLEKRGRAVRGWAEIAVLPASGGSCVIWREDLRVAGLPHLFDRPTAFAGRLLFTRVLTGLLGG